jgi:hypothetical protein
MSLVRFDANGEVVYIYEDGHPLMQLGNPFIKRASHVEPTKEGMWVADMAPVGGSALPAQVFRAGALDLEMTWLKNKLFV